MRRGTKHLLTLVCIVFASAGSLYAQDFTMHKESTKAGLKEIVPEELVYVGQNESHLFFRDAGHIVLYEFDKKLNQTGRHCLASSSLSRSNNFLFPVPAGDQIFYFNYYVQPGEKGNLVIKTNDGTVSQLLSVDLRGADKSRKFEIKRVVASANGEFVLLHFDSYNGDVYTERFITCNKNMDIVWDKEFPSGFYQRLGFSKQGSEAEYLIDNEANMFVYGAFSDPMKSKGEINLHVPHVLSFNARKDNMSYKRFIEKEFDMINFSFTYHDHAIVLGAVVQAADPEKDGISILLAGYSIDDQEFSVKNIHPLNKEILPEILDTETKEYRKNKFKNIFHELVIKEIHVHENAEVTVLAEIELSRVDNYAFYANSGVSMKLPGDEYKLNLGHLDILAFHYSDNSDVKYAKRVPKIQQRTISKQRSFVSVSSNNSVRLLFNDDKVGHSRLVSCSLNGNGDLKYQTLSKRASCKIYPLIKVESFAGDSHIARQINDHQGIFWSERGGEKLLTTVIYP